MKPLLEDFRSKLSFKLYHDADSKLAELDASLSMIREMFEKLNYIKTEGDLMDIQCREIEGKFKIVSH